MAHEMAVEVLRNRLYDLEQVVSEQQRYGVKHRQQAAHCFNAAEEMKVQIEAVKQSIVQLGGSPTPSPRKDTPFYASGGSGSLFTWMIPVGGGPSDETDDEEDTDNN